MSRSSVRCVRLCDVLACLLQGAYEASALKAAIVQSVLESIHRPRTDCVRVRKIHHDQFKICLLQVLRQLTVVKINEWAYSRQILIMKTLV